MLKWLKKYKEKKAQKAAQRDYREMLLAEKEEFTDRKEPWFAVLSMDIDYDDLSNGAFELDWNDYFIARLLKFGYQGKTDADIADQYFQNVCRNILAETWEQEQAQFNNNPSRFHNRRNIGDGRSEIS